MNFKKTNKKKNQEKSRKIKKNKKNGTHSFFLEKIEKTIVFEISQPKRSRNGVGQKQTWEPLVSNLPKPFLNRYMSVRVA